MYRHILKTTSLIASASLLKVLLGITRNKLFALWLGATGVGLIGILQNTVNLGRILFSLGIQTSGIQTIAAGNQEPSKQRDTIKTLLLIATINGVLAMAFFWQLRHHLSIWLFGSPEHSPQIMWAGISVLFSILSTTLASILQGLRQIKLLSLITVLSTTVGTLLSILLVWFLREDGIVAVIIIPPMLTGLLACLFLTKLLNSDTLPKQVPAPSHLNHFGSQVGTLIKNGIPYATTGLLVVGTQLIAKAFISSQMGLTQTGYFQAAWTISMTYIGFLLSAMGTDYLPHLSQAIKTKAYACNLINKQLTITLLLSGPIILTLIGFADWIVLFLYSQEFKPASELLIWQAYGDFFKVASWPLTFILIAARKSMNFLLMEAIWNTLYVTALITLLPIFGLESAGLSFLWAYLIYWLFSTHFAYRIVSFKMNKLNTRLLFSWLILGLALVVEKKVYHLSSHVIPLTLIVISAIMSAFLLYKALSSETINDHYHD